jgi:hypothetical protein
MRTLRLRLLKVFAGVSIPAVLLAACMTLEPAPPPPGASIATAPALKAGNYWEYAVRDGYTGLPRGLYRYTVSRADAATITIDITHDGALVDSQIYTRDLKGLELPLRNIQRFHYSPPYPAYMFPLYPGEAWKTIVGSTDVGTGHTYRTHVHASVGGWRRVAVPAGEFDALEVRRYVWAGNVESFKLQEEIVESDLYSPAVGFPVVSQGSSSHLDTSRGSGKRGMPLRVRGDWLIAELVSYSVQ